MKYLIGFVIVLFMFFAPEKVRAGIVDTVEIFSPSMQKEIRCVIIRPDAYSLSAPAYPVLYLLHGYSGNYGGWLHDAPQLKEQADRYNIMIVCPDGGYDSWYLDSPVDSTVRYETHITKEVVGYVDYYYHTRADRSGRAIAGLSMGGHGAMYLAIRHQDIFGAAGSMCGGLDLRPFKKNDWDLKGVLGSPAEAWQNWEAHSVVNLVPRLTNSNLALIIDCGVGDFFLDPNREMHRLLLLAHYPHEYYERPGEHNAAYWSNAVDFQLVFFSKFFGKKG
ncbi:MAG: alpha/beta hydrolase family protein [Bacteroidota bacterium]